MKVVVGDGIGNRRSPVVKMMTVLTGIAGRSYCISVFNVFSIIVISVSPRNRMTVSAVSDGFFEILSDMIDKNSLFIWSISDNNRRFFGKVFAELKRCFECGLYISAVAVFVNDVIYSE